MAQRLLRYEMHARALKDFVTSIGGQKLYPQISFERRNLKIWTKSGEIINLLARSINHISYRYRYWVNQLWAHLYWVNQRLVDYHWVD